MYVSVGIPCEGALMVPGRKEVHATALRMTLDRERLNDE